MRRYGIYIASLAGVVVATLLARSFILGGIGVAALQRNQLAWLTNKAFQNSIGTGYIPIEGKDYSTKVAYFNNSQWAVVSIQPIAAFSDPNTIIFKGSSNNYTIALGPSNVFQRASLASFPKNVDNYVTSLGIIDGGTSE